MKNLSKKLSSFFAAFAIVFTMGTATTTTTAEATCYYKGCYNTCSTLKYYENKYRRLANYYSSRNSYYYRCYTKKANYYRDRYNKSCNVTPPPAKTGTVCGYVLGDGKGLDGVRVKISKSGATIAQARTDKLGKWTISNIPEGQVTIEVDENDVDRHSPDDLSFLDGPVQVDNVNTITVKANQMNCGGIDSWVAKEP